MSVTIRSAYDGVSRRSSIDFSDTESMTEQCHKDLCDVNNIINQYERTGLITHVQTSTASYGDYTLNNEYAESLQTIINAQNSFEELPSNIRKQFGNDPGAFFEYATNPANSDELVKMGLANAPIIAEPLAPLTEEIIPA